MKEYGNEQGDMKAHVESYQKPVSEFSQEQFGKTLNYIERQDKHQTKQSSVIKKQSYMGRYT